MTKDTLVLIYQDRKGRNVRIFNFEDLEISLTIAQALKTAFELTLVSCTLETKSHAWRFLKMFAEHVRSQGLAHRKKLPATIIRSFREQIASTEFSESYKGHIFNRINQLVQWLVRNMPDSVEDTWAEKTKGFDTSYRHRIPRKKHLEEDQLKEILRAAYRDIADIEKRLKTVRSKLDVPESKGSEPDLIALLRDLLEFGNGRLPSQTVLRTNGELYRRVSAAGGLRFLNSQVFPTVTDVFPFYLAIVCQCSGNPMAMRLLKRDCVQPHPLLEDRVRVVWDKGRSNYEQKADFNIRRLKSAPRLIQSWLHLTEPIIKFASAEDMEYLFLVYWGGKSTVVSWQTLHNLLADFAERHRLPDFDFRDLRRAGAELHRAATGDIAAAKERLNHQSPQTTMLYVSQSNAREAGDKVIAEAQVAFSEKARQVCASEDASTYLADHPVQPAETVFGFLCRDPFAGVAKDSTKGDLCLRFSACATCPGAIIPLDDVRIVSRLLHSLDSLNEAHLRAVREGWEDRFIILYEPTRNILEQEILPKVSESVLKNARAKADTFSLFHLE